MKINIATGPCFPFPAQKGGGMIRVWQSLSNHFVGAGHDVTVLSRASKGQPANEILASGVEVRRWSGFNQPSYAAISVILDFFYAWGACHRLPDGDILVTNDFWMPFIAPRFFQNKGKVIVSVNRFPKHQMSLYSNAAILAVPSLALAREIERQSPALTEKIACIPNPYNDSAFYPDPSVERKKYGILFTGRIHPEKGIDMLLRALRLIQHDYPETELTIVGPHQQDSGGGGLLYLHKLRHLARNLPVTFSGPVFDTDELRRMYSAHTIFCYPTRADRGEALSIAPIEAMACGCIPLVSNNPIFSGWLRSGENGWSFNHHAEEPEAALATRLADILDSGARLETLHKSAIQTAERFRSDRIASDFLDHFESLLDEA